MDNYIVVINRENFEYDVNSLVKAFYPEQQVKVLSAEKQDLTDGEGPQMEIVFHEEGADITIHSGTAKKSAVWKLAEDRLCNEEKEAGIKENGKIYKDGFKRFLYRTLSEVTGQELPWGNLTGIRPTKIAYAYLEQGLDKKAIVQAYQRDHYVSQAKAELSYDIAQRERRLLSGVHYKDGYSLYIGIPFCPTTCLYCSFTSYPICNYRKETDRYVDCLIKEMEYVSESFKDKILDSVYIGGGTPTTLEAEQLERLISNLKRLFDFTTVKEFTVEAGRADSITRAKLEVLYKMGVTRISVNPQTMKQETLNIIGRKASVAQVEEAYALAREIGFDNINMDLILGLPGETEQDVQNTIDRVVELAPDSLTVHSLAIKRASRLNQWIRENGISVLNNTDETMRIAAEGARKLGLVPYYLYRQKNMSGNFENVGYAKEGKLGLYNILIMEEMQTIVALGAGSISKRVIIGDGVDGSFSNARIERCDNVKDVKLYMEQIEEMIDRKRELFKD